MKTEHLNKQILLPAGILAVCGAVAVYLACLFYLSKGDTLLQRLDTNTGEVLLEQAQRYEASGALENARQEYQRALAGRFAGEQNRVHALKRLGTLYWSEGDAAAALPLLQEANASPFGGLSTYEPLVAALIELGRLDEAAAQIEAWRTRAEQEEAPASLAAAHYQAGQLAKARGDIKGAESAFRDAILLEPRGRAAAELGYILLARGALDEALRVVDQFLAGGATGERARAAERLRADILRLQRKGATP